MNPTYLYLKIHNVTGLKYFGKTTKDPYDYMGSGKYWMRHLKKHGNDVTTTVIGLFYDVIELQLYAYEYSRLYDIVNSKEYANLIEENGLGGGGVKGRRFKRDTSLWSEEKINKFKEIGRIAGTKCLLEKKGRYKVDPEYTSERSRRSAASAKRNGNQNLSVNHAKYMIKIKETFKITGHSKGEKNPSYGKKIMYHPASFINKRIPKDLVPLYIEQGWISGTFRTEEQKEITRIKRTGKKKSNGRLGKKYGPRKKKL